MGQDSQIDEGSVSCFLKCVKHELEERACWVELAVTFGHSYVALLALSIGEQRMNQEFETLLPLVILCTIFKVYIFILCVCVNACVCGGQKLILGVFFQPSPPQLYIMFIVPMSTCVFACACMCVSLCVYVRVYLCVYMLKSEGATRGVSYLLPLWGYLRLNLGC